MIDENRSGRALIVMDMVDRYAHADRPDFTATIGEIMPYVHGELQYFRERDRPVLYINTIDPGDGNGHDPRVIKELCPRAKELSIKKARHNAFHGTDLAIMLRKMGVRNLTLVGVFTHTSIMITAASALDHGFSVVVPETCTCAKDPDDHRAALRLIRRWLSDQVANLDFIDEGEKKA